MFRYVFLILIFFSSSAYSDYQWTRATSYSTKQACASDAYNSATHYIIVYLNTDTSYRFRVYRISDNGQTGDLTCSRTGTPCSSDKEFYSPTGQCLTLCLDGQFRDSNGVCTYPDCASNEIEILSNGVRSCVAVPSLDNCKNSWDQYINYSCQKQAYDCAAEGGTFGFVDNKATCVPSDYLDDQPTCSGDFTVVDNGDGSGGVVCTPADTPKDPINPPENPNAPPPVTGGNDPANPNGVGDNTNGDGTAGSGSQTTLCKSNPALSANDPGCIEIETKNNNAASGGSGCEAPPSCSGDPIMCNILKQEYENKCAMNTFNPAQLGDLPDVDSIASESDVAGYFDSIVDDDGVTSSCPAPKTLSFTNQQFSFAPACSVMEQLRPFVIMIFAYFAARLVHKTLLEV